MAVPNEIDSDILIRIEARELRDLLETFGGSPCDCDDPVSGLQPSFFRSAPPAPLR